MTSAAYAAGLRQDAAEILAWLLPVLHSVEDLHRRASPGRWHPADAHAAARGELPDRRPASDAVDSLQYAFRAVNWARRDGKNSAALVAVIHSTVADDLAAKMGMIRDICAWRHHVVGPIDPANCTAATLHRDHGEHSAGPGLAPCVCGLADRQRQALARLAAAYRSVPGYRTEWSPA